MNELLYLLIICLIISAIGYYRLVYFISVGYGYSIAGMALFSLFIFRVNNVILFIQLLLLSIYGIRLATYLVIRDFKKSYAHELKDIKELNTQTSIFKKVGIWIGVSFLYVCMFMPAYGRISLLTSGHHDNLIIASIIGIVLMSSGIFLESLADYQKSQFKNRNPKLFCSVGIYKWIRCPNYFGELLFWTGNFIVGLFTYNNLFYLVVSLIGYICIFLIMLGSTKRLEHKQDQRYGNLEDYQRYRTTTPVLFPFLPIYTLKNIKVYLE